MQLSLPGGTSVFLAGVYLPPSSNSSVYESHLSSVDHAWCSNSFDVGIVCGDFNLPSVKWTNNNSVPAYQGVITDNVRLVGDQYSLLNFNQINDIPNVNGSLLDLIFSNNDTIRVDHITDSLITCDPYHPSLSISFPYPTAINQLDHILFVTLNTLTMTIYTET